MNALSLSQILPGAIGVTLLGYIGHKLKGGWGGILMPLAFAFPAMAAITVLTWAYFSFGDLKFVHSIFMSLGAMVVALLVNATLMMGRSVFQGTDRQVFRGHPGFSVRVYRASPLCRPAIRCPITDQLAGVDPVCGFHDLPVVVEKRRRMADPWSHRCVTPSVSMKKDFS
jgi:hypothetical protein